MTTMRTIVCACVLAAALPASAGSFNAAGSLTQEEFRQLCDDLGPALSYKGVTPATPLGALGFDAGVEVTDTRVDHGELFSRAGAGGTSDLVVPKLHVYKGLFAGLDLGAFVARASAVGANLLGLDLRYALWDDGLARPAVALRVSATKAWGMGDVSVSTGAVDALVSKQIAGVTPYAGAGVVRVFAHSGRAALADENFNRGRAFAGLNVNLLAANLALEAEKMAGITSLSAKLGLRF